MIQNGGATGQVLPYFVDAYNAQLLNKKYKELETHLEIYNMKVDVTKIETGPSHRRELSNLYNFDGLELSENELLRIMVYKLTSEGLNDFEYALEYLVGNKRWAIRMFIDGYENFDDEEIFPYMEDAADQYYFLAGRQFRKDRVLKS